MRRFSSSSDLSPSPGKAGDTGATRAGKTGWETLATLIPYLWEYRGRVQIGRAHV